jgi:hypothetical protein
VANRAFGNRPEFRCAACVPIDFPDRFVEIEDADLMSVAKGLAVTDHQVVQHADIDRRFLRDSALRHSYGAVARTLASLLDEVKVPLGFDLLSLDVEGNELAVLRGLDLQRYQPKWIRDFRIMTLAPIFCSLIVTLSKIEGALLHPAAGLLL